MTPLSEHTSSAECYWERAYWRTVPLLMEQLVRIGEERNLARERIELAKGALVRTGYFRPDEVSEDVAPRITELWSAIPEEARPHG